MRWEFLSACKRSHLASCRHVTLRAATSGGWDALRPVPLRQQQLVSKPTLLHPASESPNRMGARTCLKSVPAKLPFLRLGTNRDTWFPISVGHPFPAIAASRVASSVPMFYKPFTSCMYNILDRSYRLCSVALTVYSTSSTQRCDFSAQSCHLTVLRTGITG